MINKELNNFIVRMEDIIRDKMISRLFQEGKYCWCGCGGTTNIYRGKHRQFTQKPGVHLHNFIK